MIEFMNFETTTFPYFGSGLISRLSARWRRDIGSLASRQKQTAPLLGPFRSVFRPALLAVLHALGVEHAAQDVVANTREVLDAAAADHHHRVLLQVMTLARDVADHLESIRQPDLGDFAQ